MFSDNKYTIKANLAEKFSGIIWKIEIDDALPLIVVETRDSETRKSLISLFNFETGDCLFKEISVEDSWNWNLDRLHNGITYLHSFLTNETPVHKGIIALNSKGSILWQAHNKTLEDISTEGLIAFDPKMQPRWLELIEPTSGIVTKSTIQNYSPVSRDINVPDFLYDQKIIPVELPQNIVGEIAYCRFNEKDIVSYHTKDGEVYSQQLLVTEGGKVILKEKLASGILKLNPEAFFISRSHLFCIRSEKREIVSYLV